MPLHNLGVGTVVYQKYVSVSTLDMEHQVVIFLHINNMSPKSHSHIPHLLRHADPNSSDPHPPGLPSVDVSGYQRNVAYHVVSTTARSLLGQRPCGICAMLYVSQHQGLASLGHQGVGDAALGSWSRRSEREMMKMRVQRSGKKCFCVLSHELTLSLRISPRLSQG